MEIKENTYLVIAFDNYPNKKYFSHQQVRIHFQLNRHKSETVKTVARVSGRLNFRSGFSDRVVYGNFELGLMVAEKVVMQR